MAVAGKPRACQRCWIVKPVEAFPRRGVREVKRISTIDRPSSVCWLCREIEAWDYYESYVIHRKTWWVNVNGRRVRRRRCCDCGEVKAFPVNFYVLRTPKPGQVTQYTRECKVCHGRKSSAVKRARLENPATAARAKRQSAEASKRWRRRNAAKAREASRKWKAKIQANPRLHAQMLEDHRINYRLKREREGLPVRPVTHKPPAAVMQECNEHRLPVGPLLSFVEERIRVRLVVEPGTHVGEVCGDLGITTRTLYRWREEGGSVVTFDLAERVVLLAGVDFESIWPPADYGEVYTGLLAA